MTRTVPPSPELQRTLNTLPERWRGLSTENVYLAVAVSLMVLVVENATWPVTLTAALAGIVLLVLRFRAQGGELPPEVYAPLLQYEEPELWGARAELYRQNLALLEGAKIGVALGTVVLVVLLTRGSELGELTGLVAFMPLASAVTNVQVARLAAQSAALQAAVHARR